MDEGSILSTIKIVSAVASGAFGTMGLLTEYKDHATKRITKWGYVALGGILASTTLGVTAQIIDSDASAKSAAASAQRSEQTASLAQIASSQSSRGVHEIERILEPLKEVRLELIFQAHCAKSASEEQSCDQLDEALRKALCCDPSHHLSAVIKVSDIGDHRVARPDQIAGEIAFSGKFREGLDFASEDNFDPKRPETLQVHVEASDGVASGYKPPASIVDLDSLTAKLVLDGAERLSRFKLAYGSLKSTGGHHTMLEAKRDDGSLDDLGARRIDIEFWKHS